MFEDNAQAGLLMQMFITYAQTQNPHHHPARPRKPMRRRIRRTTAPFAYGRFNTKDEPAREQAEHARQSPRARRDASTLQAIVRNAAHTRPRAHRSRERAWTIQTLFSTTDQQPPRRCNHLQSVTSRKKRKSHAFRPETPGASVAARRKLQIKRLRFRPRSFIPQDPSTCICTRQTRTIGIHRCQITPTCCRHGYSYKGAASRGAC